ncbi:nucleotidyltransferase family protein [Roseburia hominis]
MRVELIYLAAGNSRRFKRVEMTDRETGETVSDTNKLLYEVEGKPMYLHLLERLLHICERHSGWEVLVVTQHQKIYEAVRRMQEEGRKVRPVWSPDSAKGASYSVKAGVLAAEESRECHADACAFFVADQPYLTEESAEGFLMEMEKTLAPLGSVRCKDAVGNPTWFSRIYFEELLGLSGDRGGRKVLKAHPEDVRYFAIEDEKELRDIDYCSQVERTL